MSDESELTKITGKPPRYEGDCDVRSGSCPVHPDVRYFVRVAGANAFVCPFPPETHVRVDGWHLRDFPYGIQPEREGR